MRLHTEQYVDSICLAESEKHHQQRSQEAGGGTGLPISSELWSTGIGLPRERVWSYNPDSSSQQQQSWGSLSSEVDQVSDAFGLRLTRTNSVGIQKSVDDRGHLPVSRAVSDSARLAPHHHHHPHHSQRVSSFRKGRFKLESEDSSYDSDHEYSSESSGRHDDVSRTVSDTLGAEFAEYVTLSPGSHDTSPLSQTTLLEEEVSVGVPLDSVLADPSYTSRVEFALKLGYTEQQVQVALQKLGASPSQNELLAELISLGANTKPLTTPPGETAADIQTAVNQETKQSDTDAPDNLRKIVIDGSNVAMGHGNKDVFSCLGIRLCVDWFRSRGHRDITVFVPKWRKEASKPDTPIADQDVLLELEKERLLVFTPSRHVGGRRLVCYDDRYILKLAVETDGIVVSNDNYRDLALESPEFRKVIEERILMYSFVNDRFMPPDDPLGRNGPTLDNFLRKSPRLPDPLPPPCPYGKKCTYGNKCKFYHPERGNQPQKSITERLMEQSQIKLQEVKARGMKGTFEEVKGKSVSLPLPPVSGDTLDSGVPRSMKKQPLSRTCSTVPTLSLTPDQDSFKDGRNMCDDSLHSRPMGPSLSPTNSGSANLGPKSTVCKSKSVENVALEAKLSPLGVIPVTETFNLSRVEQDNQFDWSQGYRQRGLGLSVGNLEVAGIDQRHVLYGDNSVHYTIAKKLSDPERNSGPTVHEAVEPEGNMHKKLQRQLTLNPTYDPRLYQMHGFSPSNQMVYLPQPHEQYMAPTKPSTTQSLHLQAHSNVTRIASAPDSYLKWSHQLPAQRSGHMQRLNSTSDTQLNLYGIGQDTAPATDPFDGEPWVRNTQLGNTATIVTSTPPNQPHPVCVPISSWPSMHHPFPPSTPSFPPAQTSPGPVGSRPISPQQFSKDSHIKNYDRLVSIFPPEQVQAVMAMFPGETDPQKLCALILKMFNRTEN